MTQEIPPLRSDLTFEPVPGDPSAKALFDRVLGRRIRLDPRGVQIAEALDAPQSLDELAERLGAEEEGLARVVGQFRQLNLLATPEALEIIADAEAIERMAQAPAEDVPLLVRDDARFTCVCCGSCCGGHNIGPLGPGEIEGLTPHMPALAERARATKGLLFAVPPGDATREAYCHIQDGWCVFLTDEQRCEIHEHHGEELKPRGCRLFPMEIVATPRGVAVAVQMECRGFWEGRDGHRLADSLPDLRKLLAIAPENQLVGSTSPCA